MQPLPYGRQVIDDTDIAAVEDVLRSDWLTQGPAVPAFEAALCARSGARYAVAVTSATSALHIACLAAGLGPGDRVWTSPNTFVASANCARYCGADVDFVDIDPRSWCLDMEALEIKLRRSAGDGTLPKIVIPVAFAGRSSDMRRLWELASEFGFCVIEDASHAVGATHHGLPVGSGAHAHMTVFSFHPVKIITTGEGGVVLTNTAALHHRLCALRSHGITRDAAEMDCEPDGPWYYQMLELGFNYRMTDLQAALGASQLRRLDTFLTRRRHLARRYHQMLSGLPLQLPLEDPFDESAWHLYVVRLSLPAILQSRREVVERLRNAGIMVNVHYLPVHLHPYYRRLGFSPGDFPCAEQYYREAISLPIFAAMSDADQDRVVSELEHAIR